MMIATVAACVSQGRGTSAGDRMDEDRVRQVDACEAMVDRTAECSGGEPTGGRSIAVETCRAEREQERRAGRFNDAMESAWLACLAVERCDDLDRCFAVVFRDAQENRALRVDTAKRTRDLASKLADECRLLGGHLREPPVREDALAPADVICDAAAELCSFHQELTAQGYVEEKDAPDPRRTGYDLAPCDRPAYVGDGILMPRWRSRLRVKRARENLAREAR